jgi:hypothetical protein
MSPTVLAPYSDAIAPPNFPPRNRICGRGLTSGSVGVARLLSRTLVNGIGLRKAGTAACLRMVYVENVFNRGFTLGKVSVHRTCAFGFFHPEQSCRYRCQLTTAVFVQGPSEGYLCQGFVVCYSLEERVHVKLTASTDGSTEPPTAEHVYPSLLWTSSRIFAINSAPQHRA